MAVQARSPQLWIRRREVYYKSKKKMKTIEKKDFSKLPQLSQKKYYRLGFFANVLMLWPRHKEVGACELRMLLLSPSPASA